MVSRTVLPLGMSNIVDDGTVTTCKLQCFQQDCIWKLACTRLDLDFYMIIFLVRLNLLNFIHLVHLRVRATGGPDSI